MIEFVLVSVFGLVIGILIGLMPMMPIYLGSFLMYFFLFDWQLQSLLIFWIATLIGSQFFGSVAAITLGIPGESSSVVYVNQVRKLPLNQRAKLLWKTARGSHIAGFTAIVLVWLILTQFTGLHYLGNHWLKLFFYTFAIGVFMFMDRRPWVSMLLIMFGLFLSPGNNLVLPEWYYKLQFVFQDITFYMVIMGLMILPEFMFANEKQPQCEYRKLPRPRNSLKDSIIYAKHTIVGLIAGCIPGPCADVASAVSFKTQKGGIKDKVVAAETANNSACIFMLVPFFAIGVPITMTSLIMANVLDIKGIEILQTFEAQPHLLHQIVGMAMLLNFANYVLAVRFISVYTTFLKFVQNKILGIQVLLVVALVIADIWMSEAQLMTYIPLMCATTCLGCLLKFKRINPIPLVFAMLLGDTLIWTYLQTYYIIF